jgi:hypothetical protein
MNVIADRAHMICSEPCTLRCKCRICAAEMMLDCPPSKQQIEDPGLSIGMRDHELKREQLSGVKGYKQCN